MLESQFTFPFVSHTTRVSRVEPGTYRRRVDKIPPRDGDSYEDSIGRFRHGSFSKS